MVHFEEKAHYDLQDLRQIVHLLRAPGGCPWDAAQTHASLRRQMREQEIGADGILHRAIRHRIGIGHAVFGDIKRQITDIILRHAGQKPLQALGVDLPAHLGAGAVAGDVLEVGPGLAGVSMAGQGKGARGGAGRRASFGAADDGARRLVSAVEAGKCSSSSTS